MAEALAPVPDPVLTGLRIGPWTSAASVARALARELLPDEASITPPEWLLDGQVGSFRRVLAALERFGGALLADPLGSGKTYVGLAVARVLRHGRAACVAPATLLPQWEATARRLDIELELLSHEQVSRGHVPGQRQRLVLVDEAHRFRNPLTRRYRALAPCLVGRRALLITATPIVNRLDDLLHQLLLCVRDDALLAEGVPSLRALLRAGRGAPALGRLVVERRPPMARPERTEVVSTPGVEEAEAARAVLALIDGLALSRSGPIASLVRTVLRHAAASSPPALLGALRRYRRLLYHARDARRAGRPMDRAAIRRFTGAAGDQLVLWELFAAEAPVEDLNTDDLERIDHVVACAEAMSAGVDAKAGRLADLLRDGIPTLVFVSRRETVRHLRARLGRGLAWCTGDRAGLDHTTLPRATVLGWFREAGEPTAMTSPAQHLLVTDVAAEGLDLQRAARVVHYDLPWTPMRLDQRDGRAVRLGSRHRSVEIVRFALPAPLERALRIEVALRRKRRLPADAGIGPAGSGLWRWRSELAESLATGLGECGVATVPAGPAGALVGFGIHSSGPGGPLRLGFVLGWLDEQGRWSEDEETVAARLTQAASDAAETAPDVPRLHRTLPDLAAPVRARLESARERRWSTGECQSPARIVIGRLQQIIRDAARRRDARALETLGRALAFVAGGHTAGEALLVQRLAEASTAELARAAERLPVPSGRFGPVEARLVGILLFGPPAARIPQSCGRRPSESFPPTGPSPPRNSK